MGASNCTSALPVSSYDGSLIDGLKHFVEHFPFASFAFGYQRSHFHITPADVTACLPLFRVIDNMTHRQLVEYVYHDKATASLKEFVLEQLRYVNEDYDANVVSKIEPFYANCRGVLFGRICPDYKTRPGSVVIARVLGCIRFLLLNQVAQPLHVLSDDKARDLWIHTYHEWVDTLLVYDDEAKRDRFILDSKDPKTQDAIRLVHVMRARLQEGKRVSKSSPSIKSEQASNKSDTHSEAAKARTRSDAAKALNRSEAANEPTKSEASTKAPTRSKVATGSIKYEPMKSSLETTSPTRTFNDDDVKDEDHKAVRRYMRSIGCKCNLSNGKRHDDGCPVLPTCYGCGIRLDFDGCSEHIARCERQQSAQQPGCATTSSFR